MVNDPFKALSHLKVVEETGVVTARRGGPHASPFLKEEASR
jgi:hypothetical protein